MSKSRMDSKPLPQMWRGRDKVRRKRRRKGTWGWHSSCIQAAPVTFSKYSLFPSQDASLCIKKWKLQKKKKSRKKYHPWLETTEAAAEKLYTQLEVLGNKKTFQEQKQNIAEERQISVTSEMSSQTTEAQCISFAKRAISSPRTGNISRAIPRREEKAKDLGTKLCFLTSY